MAKIFDKINLLKNTSVNDNLLINGNFDVWQRGTSFITNGYTADRWYLSVDGGVRAYRMVGGGSLANTTSFIRIETTSSGSYGSIGQAISSDITSQIRGNYVSLSFYAKCPTGVNNWTGNIYTRSFYSLLSDNIINKIPVENSSYNNTIATNNTWNKYSTSFYIPTNASTLYIEILPSGALSSNAIIDIAQIKLENGTTATALKPLSINEELDNCQRYYQKVDVKLKAGTGYGSGSSKKFGISIPLPKQPRKSTATINRIIAESNDSLLSNIQATISNNQYLSVTADSNSPYSELSSIFSIDSEIYPASTPGMVNNIQATRSNTNINIFWDPAIENNSPITSYSVYYDTNATFLNNVISFTGVSGTITGTNPVLNYYVKLLASNAVGTGALSNLYSIGSLYSIPSGIGSATGIWGNDIAYLSWLTPTGDGGTPVTGYVVQRSMYSNYSNIDLSYYTNSIRANLTKSSQQITATGSYYFRVAALNLAGTGSYTNFTVPKTKPYPPTNLSTLSENQKITLYYSSPTGNGGDPVSLVDILYSTSSSFATSTGITVVADYKPVVVTGLTNSVTYYAKTRSYNNLGYSDYSSAITAVPNRPLTVPGSPSGLSASWTMDAYTPTNPNVVYNNIVLSWDAPTDDGGSPIINYSIAAASGSSFTTDIINTSTINNNRSINITWPTGLVDYPQIYLRVKANNNIGSSSWSTGVLLRDTTPLWQATPPGLSNIIPGNTTGTVYYGPSYFSQGSPITGYSIQYATNSSFTSASTIVRNANTCNPCSGYYSNVPCTATISNLTNNVIHYVRVAPINSSGIGSYSNILSFTPVNPITVPSEPLSLNGIRIKTTGTSTVTNKTPIYLTSNPTNMISYRNSINQIYAIPVVGSAGGIVWGCNNLFTDDSTIASAAVNQGVLTIGQTGYVFVEMLPGASSYQSCTKNGVTTNYWPSWAASYRFLDYIGCTGNNGISLSWSSPTNNGGSSITGYVIQSGSNTNFTGFAPTITVSNSPLTYSSCASSGTFYTRIAAVNSIGTGAWSSIVGISGILTSPAAPTNFTATTGGLSGNYPIVNLSWTAPTNFGNAQNLSSYYISYNPTIAPDLNPIIPSSVYPNGNSTSQSLLTPYSNSWLFSIQSYNGQFYSDRVYTTINITGSIYSSPTTWTFLPGGQVYVGAYNVPLWPLINYPTQSNLSLPQGSVGSQSWAAETFGSDGMFFTADFGSIKQISNLYYAGIYGTTQSYPLSPMNGVKIQGSNNNNTWSDIATMSGLAAQTTYQFPINVAYRYIRLFTGYNSRRYWTDGTSSPTCYLQIGRLYFT